MSKYIGLLAIAKQASIDALNLLKGISRDQIKIDFCDEVPREMKASVDGVLEQLILKALRPTKIGILSEEFGEDDNLDTSDLHWIVDPLDGTVNYVRGLGPCAVSIALWKGKIPIFGVVGEYPSGTIWWGGKEIGAFSDTGRLRVSGVKKLSQAVLCTGFPSRFDLSRESMDNTLQNLLDFGKVRMLGAASLSIIKVANGSAEVYSERDIMIWDVAAGLAIVEGAGGRVKMSPGRFTHSYNVIADNCLIDWN